MTPGLQAVSKLLDLIVGEVLQLCMALLQKKHKKELTSIIHQHLPSVFVVSQRENRAVLAFVKTLYVYARNGHVSSDSLISAFFPGGPVAPLLAVLKT
jgi:hypothetical protein